MKQGLKLKQDFGNRRGGGLREGLPQQALGDAVVAGVKGGQDVHFLGGQAGHAALAAEEAGEDAGEAGHGPDVPLPCRVKVDALAGVVAAGRPRARPARRRDSAGVMGPAGGAGGGWG